MKKLIFLIPFLLFLIISCSVTTISSYIWQLNNSVQTMKAIVQNNKQHLNDEELKVLKFSYQDWQDILKSLEAHGCGISKIAKETCRLDIPTVRFMHNTAKDDYLKVRAIALAHLKELSIEDKTVLQEFDKKAQALDQALIEFESNSNSEGTLNMIAALSGLAKIAVKITPIILSLI